MNKRELKQAIKQEIIELGKLEEGGFLDESSSFIELELSQSDLEELVISIEDQFGITFDTDVFLEDTVKDLLEASYS